jgi:uncharacterized membrane protein
MWFIGALVGGVLGAMAFGGGGFVFGALFGGVVGGFIGFGNAMNTKSRLETLEGKVAALEAAMGGAPRPAASPPAKEPEPAAARPPEVVEIPLPEPQPASEPEPVFAKTNVWGPQPQPQPRTASAGPDFWERLVGGNLVAKVGILVLFIGVAFLVKYFYERIHVPIELRLTGVAIGALVVLAFGWRLRESRPGYALILQGGGIAVLYLVIFSAFRLFGVLPGPLAFALLVGVAAASVALAIAQNSLTLAVIAVSGGFLAPILASTGRGSHVMLFSYYAVLNAGIFAIAWVKAWRVLNILGFAFTFGIGTLWGAYNYRPEMLASTEPFLALFFAMYLAIPILFATKRAVELKDYVDGTLVFGTPVVAFSLQAAAVRHIEYAAAYSAFFVAVVYLALALALFRRTGQGLRMLVESYIALGVAFATLAIPLAFEGRLTSAAWALEGAAVVWIGVRQARLLPRVFGYLLQLAAGVAFLADIVKGYGTTPVLNSFAMGCLFLAAAAFFCSAYLERNWERVHKNEPVLRYLFIGWGLLWWYGGGVHELQRFVPWPERSQAVLMYFAASSVAFSMLSTRLKWRSARWLWLLLYPAMVMQAGIDIVRAAHPFAYLGVWAWLAAFAAHLWLLSRHEDDETTLVNNAHSVGVWLLALVGAREVGWQIDAAVEGRRVWPLIAWAIVPAGILLALVAPAVQARFPVVRHLKAYVVGGGAPLAVFLAMWTVYANITSDGDPTPLPFVPLLNPLDIAIGAAFLVLARWLASLSEHGLEDWWKAARTPVFLLFGAVAFLWVNATLLRTLHHWAGLPFALEPMLSSAMVQSAFSILWTLLALGAMMVATRRRLRPLWIVGALLMAVVVAKLFLVDLSGVGTVERIVSFIGVGLLMLLVGYLSPVPPKEATA